MIDPRMIRPEAVAPTTDIVTPTPQYYGQGQVVGGQIQLGDVYGKLPSQSQEEYMYGNLANIANAAMGLAQAPSQIEQAEKQRKQRHDENAFFEYEQQQNKVEQARLNQESAFNWGNDVYNISSPEDYANLTLSMQEKYLGNLWTDAAKARASSIKTNTLAFRNKNVDARISELMQEYDRKFEIFNQKTLLLTDPDRMNLLASDTELNNIIEQIHSYRDTDSAIYEAATNRITKDQASMQAASVEYVLNEATVSLGMTMDVLASNLFQMWGDFQEQGVVAAETLLKEEFPDLESLLPKIGIQREFAEEGAWTQVSGGLAESFSTRPSIENSRALLGAIIDHTLRQTPQFAQNPPLREAYAQRLLSSIDNTIVSQINKIHAVEIVRRTNEAEIGRSIAINDYVTSDDEIPPSNMFIRLAEEEATGLITTMTINADNPRENLFAFVNENINAYYDQNYGTPDVPLTTQQIQTSRTLLGTGEPHEKLYEQRNGELFLTEVGIRYLENEKRKSILNVIKSSAYTEMVAKRMDAIEYDRTMLGSPLGIFTEKLYKYTVGSLRNYYPLGNFSDEEILATLGIGDVIEDPLNFKPQILDIIKNPDFVKQEVESAIRTWERSNTNQNGSRVSNGISDKWGNISPKDALDDDNLVLDVLAFGRRYEELLESSDPEKAITNVMGEYVKAGVTAAQFNNIRRAYIELGRNAALTKSFVGNLKNYGLVDPSFVLPKNLQTLMEDISNNELGTITKIGDIILNDINPETGYLTPNGTLKLAKYQMSLARGHKANPEGVDKFQDLVDQTAVAGELLSNNPKLRNIPFIILASVVEAATVSTIGGVANQHAQAIEQGLAQEIEYIDQDGLPQKAPAISVITAESGSERFRLLFSNTQERTTDIGLKFAFNMTRAIRGALEHGSLKDVHEFIDNQRLKYISFLNVARRNDSSSMNTDILTSAFPIDKRNNIAKQTGNPTSYMNMIDGAIRNKEEDKLIRLIASASNLPLHSRSENFVTTPSEINTINPIILNQILLGALDFLSRTNANKYVKVTSELADMWNTGVKNEQFYINEGDVIPYYGAGNTASLSSILSRGSRRGEDMYFGDWWDKENEMNKIINSVFRDYIEALDFDAGIGEGSPFGEVLSRLSYAYNNNLIDPEDANSSIRDRLGIIGDFALMNAPITNQVMHSETLFSGTTNLGRRQNPTPSPYIVNGGSIMPHTAPITSRDGNPLFQNHDHMITGIFFEAMPTTSKNPAAFAMSREKYFYRVIVGSDMNDQTFNNFSPEIRERVRQASQAEISNGDFLYTASQILQQDPSTRGRFVFDRPALTYNIDNMPASELQQAYNRSGWGRVSDRQNPYGYRINTDQNSPYYQNFVIQNDATMGTGYGEIPLGADIMKFIDAHEVLDRLINVSQPGTIKGERAKRKAEIMIGGIAGALLLDSPISIEEERESIIDSLINPPNKDKQSPISMNIQSTGSPPGILGGATQALGMTAAAAMEPVALRKVALYIRQYEGAENKVYADSKGIPTIGVGHNLKANDSKKTIQKVFNGSISHADLVSGKVTLTNEQVQKLFEADIERHLPVAHRLFGGKKRFEDFPEFLQIALLDGVFNGRFKSSHTTTKAIKAGNWDQAARNVNKSKAYDAVLETEKRRIAEGKGPTRGGTLERYKKLEEALKKMAELKRNES